MGKYPFWPSDRPPKNEREVFNLRHSSLRTTIERGFGVLKKCFQDLDTKPFWSFETQVEVVLVCCVIYNHIMGVDSTDYIMEATMNQVVSVVENWKYVHVRTPLRKVEYGMLRKMRYAKPCGLIIPGVENNTLNMCDSDFYSCNM